MDELQALKDQLHKQIDDCQDEERLRAMLRILMGELEFSAWHATYTKREVE